MVRSAQGGNSERPGLWVAPRERSVDGDGYRRTYAVLSRFGLVLALAFLTSCVSVEEKRIRQLLHEKGFGSRADGVATAENYVSGGDTVQFFIDPNVYRQPGHEQLFLLTQPQPIGLDGTIFVPYIGPIYVLGMTETELAEMISQLLDGLFTTSIRAQCRITSRGKVYFMFGEVVQAARRVRIAEADLTVLDVIAEAPITELANLGRVKVIKPDAQNPLVIVVNVREILETGNTTYNLRIDDNDIIYIPPTWLGHIARFLEKLFSPLAVLTRSLFGLGSARASIDYLYTGQGGFNQNRRF